MNMRTKETPQVKVVKKKYASPTLTKYGKVVEITAGGSMGQNENLLDPKKDRFRP